MSFTEFVLFFTDSILYLTMLIIPLYLWGEDKEELMLYLLILFLTGGLVYLLKFIFAVPRPPNAIVQLSSNAFPSTHAALGFFPLGFFFHKKKWRIPLFVYAVLITYSRVYLRVHYLSDVLVGALIGFLFPFIIYQKYFRSKRRK